MIKHLLSRFKAPLIQLDYMRGRIEDDRKEISKLQYDYNALVDEAGVLKNNNRLQEKEIETLKQIIKNNRRMYSGQKFYNPNDHKAATIYVCARFRDWYMIRQSNELTPVVMDITQFDETYPGYVAMPAMNANRKNLS